MAMATVELPLRSPALPSSAGFAVRSECCASSRIRFSAGSAWKSSLLLSFKEARSRARCCMSVEVENESPESMDFDSQFVDARSLRAAEKFAVLDTGKWECRSCGYIYDQSTGDPLYPIAAGTEFRKLPEDWRCPTCGAAKSYFNSKSVEVAGFAENQKYGLGTNSLTSGQKSILIYGSLAFFFFLFLAGYFLQ